MKATEYSLYYFYDETDKCFKVTDKCLPCITIMIEHAIPDVWYFKTQKIICKRIFSSEEQKQVLASTTYEVQPMPIWITERPHNHRYFGFDSIYLGFEAVGDLIHIDVNLIEQLVPELNIPVDRDQDHDHGDMSPFIALVDVHILAETVYGNHQEPEEEG